MYQMSTRHYDRRDLKLLDFNRLSWFKKKTKQNKNKQKKPSAENLSLHRKRGGEGHYNYDAECLENKLLQL